MTLHSYSQSRKLGILNKFNNQFNNITFKEMFRCQGHSPERKEEIKKSKRVFSWWEYMRDYYYSEVYRTKIKYKISENEKKKIIDKFIYVLENDYSPFPRSSAARVLGEISGKDNEKVLNALINGTEDQRTCVRIQSIIGLGILGNKKAGDCLERILLKQGRREVVERYFSAISLGMLKDEKHISVWHKIIVK